MNPANAWLLLTTRSRGVDFMPAGFGALKPADVALAMQGLPRERFLIGMAKLAGDLSCLHELEHRVCARVTTMAAVGEWTFRRGSLIIRRLSALALYEVLNGERCIACNGKGTADPLPKAPRTEAERSTWAAQRSAEVQALNQSLRRLHRLQWRLEALSEQRRAGQSVPNHIKRVKSILRWIELHQLAVDIVREPRTCESCNGRGTRKLTETHRAWLAGVSRSQWHRTWESRYEPLRLEVEGWVSDCLTHVRARFANHAA